MARVCENPANPETGHDHRHTHLAEIIENGSDADLLGDMMTVVDISMMALDVESLSGATNHGREAPTTSPSSFARATPGAAVVRARRTSWHHKDTVAEPLAHFRDRV